MVPVFLSLFFLAIFHLCFWPLSEQLASPPPFSSIHWVTSHPCSWLTAQSRKMNESPLGVCRGSSTPPIIFSPFTFSLSLLSLAYARYLTAYALYRAATEECNSGLQTSLCFINMLIGRGSVSACVWINGYALQWFRPGSQKEASVQGCLRTQHNRAFQPSHSRMRERVCVHVSISEKGKERNIQPPAAESGGGKHGDLLPV